MEPEPPGAAFFCLEPEPESAPGPWRPGAGAAQKSGGSATLFATLDKTRREGRKKILRWPGLASSFLMSNMEPFYSPCFLHIDKCFL